MDAGPELISSAHPSLIAQLNSSKCNERNSPASILIVGSGEFGLTTALFLALSPLYTSTEITVLDRLPFPAVDGSSIDSSRIVRTDYSSPAYVALCNSAQKVWRGLDASHPLHGIGDEGRYTELGLVLTANEGEEGVSYVDSSYRTVSTVLPELNLELLPTREDVQRACKLGGGGTGVRGYANWSSGWADAEKAMIFLRERVAATGRVRFQTGEAASLNHDPTGRVTGVLTSAGEELHAALTILATGAWTPSLLDLSGRSIATGQVLGYLPVTLAEAQRLEAMPVVFNLSTGIFFIYHQADKVLKVARHASGYLHPQTTRDGREGVSTPLTGIEIPEDAQREFYAALKEILPDLPEDRKMEKTRMCWYNDTATGDFIVSNHPTKPGLFLATGGSGHAFKFLPVLGEHIVAILSGSADAGYKDLWAWPEAADKVVNKDGSRAGGDGGEHLLLCPAT
ncbi:fructosyl amino acid oxidasesarcosine oxidase [Sphaerosporella brunnea]|uniref:Fructosyl amino acid oxidasesarcosine oxidase n=1 Tax=Sphaerosporella brunnea TaxID=1250544 RepID=A0A5J5FAQ7_9PEZI|nr:fructosyl amino acid oxidasesarcosine oxidase [Sphaerosporella brunnea]